MDVVARRAGAGFAVVAKDFLQFLEQIGLGTEGAQMLVAVLALLDHFGPHLGAVIAMERIALDVGRGYIFAAEDVLESPLHRRGAGAGRAGDRYDGIAARHPDITGSREKGRAARTA